MYSSQKAFTLVEIIIALSIVALFVTIPMLAYGNYAKTQRDIKRKSDINQIASSLQQYKASTGKYPATAEFPQSLVDAGYLPKIPTDPYEGRTIPDSGGLTYSYNYESDGSGYQLSARLEDVDDSAGEGDASWYVSSPLGAETVTVVTAETTGIPTVAPPGGATNTPIPSLTKKATLTPSPTRTLTPSRTPTPTIPEFSTIVYEADTGIYDIVRGSDGNIWYITDSGSLPAGKLTVGSGTLNAYALTGCGLPNDIVSTTGKLWFSSSSNKICSLNTSGALVDSFTVPTTDNRSITLGSDNNIWFASTSFNTIYRMNPSTGTTTAYSIATPRLVESETGYIWYASYVGGNTVVGRINISNGEITSFGQYVGEPLDMAIKSGSAFVATNDNYILEFTNSEEQYLLPVPLTRVESVSTNSTNTSLFYSGLDSTTPRLGQINTTTRTDIDNWVIPTTASYEPKSVLFESSSIMWYTTGRWIYKLTFN